VLKTEKNFWSHRRDAKGAERKKLKLCERCAYAVNNINPHSPKSHIDHDVSVSAMNRPSGTMNCRFPS
jgi:hypothetical protein